MAVNTALQKSKTLLVMVVALLSSRSWAAISGSITGSGSTITVNMTTDNLSQVGWGVSVTPPGSGSHGVAGGYGSTYNGVQSWSYTFGASGNYMFVVTWGNDSWTFYEHWNGTNSLPVDANGHPLNPDTQPVSGNGGSCKVWATRAGNVGTVHIGSFTLPTGVIQVAITWSGNPPGTDVLSSGLGTDLTATNVDHRDFDLSGVPDGSGQGVLVQYSDPSTGELITIWQGNIQFPTAATVNQSPPVLAPVSDPTQSTVSSNGPNNAQNGGTTTTAPIAGPTNSSAGGTGGTGGTSGLAANSVWSQADPGTPAATQGGTGTGTDASGNSMDTRIANAKAALTSAFLLPTFSTGGATDKVITVNPGSIGGVSLAFSIHTAPDTSTTMGAALDTIRLVIRTFAAVFVVFTLYQCCWKALRRI